MTPEQRAKIEEAIRECAGDENIPREEFIIAIRGYLAPEDEIFPFKGPVPTEWIQQIMNKMLCPLCPNWAPPELIGPDFFGDACLIDGVRCCSTCYNVHHLTSDEEDNPLSDEEAHCDDQENVVDGNVWATSVPPDPKMAWKTLYSLIREKCYEVYCGYHQDMSDFTITGHADGENHTYFASMDGLTRAINWLEIQGHGLSEDERIERRAHCWEERKLIEASVPDTF